MVRSTIVAAVVATALVAPAAAEANHLYLSAGEAARLTGKALHTEYTNVARGSLNATCPAVPGRRDYRVCVYSYYDQAGTCWKGVTAIRLVSPSRYRYRIWSDRKCHGWA